MVEYISALYHTKGTSYERAFVKKQDERRNYGWYLQKSQPPRHDNQTQPNRTKIRLDFLFMTKLQTLPCC